MITRRSLLKSLSTSAALLSAPTWASRALASAAAPQEQSFFLTGNYAPVHTEHDIGDLKVIGEIPADLNGLYVRNGPNPAHPPLGKYHWFDGDGMLHGVHLSEGKARYINRFVQTEGLGYERKAGEALWPGLNDNPLKGKAPRKAPVAKNAGNTALTYHNGKLMALWEAGNPHLLDPQSLETLGEYDFEGQLDHAFTAHPKIDPQTGELITFAYQFIGRPRFMHSVFDAQGQRVSHSEVKLPHRVMIHDCAITPNYTLILDLPESIRLGRAMRNRGALSYEPKNGARIGLLPRHGKGSDVRFFEINPCYIFHTLGAYEAGDEVILLAARYDEFPENINAGVPFPPRQTQKHAQLAYLYEWRLNLKTERVSERALDDRAIEFPKLHPGYMGQKNRYGYAPAFDYHYLYKYDLETGETQTHNMRAQGSIGGEAVFIPRVKSGSEDDGYLINFRYHFDTQLSEIHILDAQNIEGESLARVLLPVRVPFGFHGEWVPQSPTL